MSRRARAYDGDFAKQLQLETGRSYSDCLRTVRELLLAADMPVGSSEAIRIASNDESETRKR